MMPFRFQGQSFTIDGPADDLSVMRIVRETERYEEWLWNIVAPLLKQDDVCLDIGANVGLSTLILCARCPTGRVYAFEPNPSLNGYLEQNLNKNGFKQATVVPAALGSGHGTASLVVSASSEGFDYGGGMVRTGLPDSAHSISVPLLDLDTWAIQEQLSRIDFIKVDAEGFEMEILRGGMRTLRHYRPNVAIEFFPQKLRQVEEDSDHKLITHLIETFPFVYLVDRFTGKAIRVRSAAQLRGQMMTGHGVEDLLCLWSPLPGEAESEGIDLSSYEASHLHINSKGSLHIGFLSQYPDGWVSRQQFGAAILNNGDRKQTMELEILEAACRNLLRICLGNRLITFEVERGACEERHRFDCEPGVTMIFLESSKAVNASDYFRNSDPRVISVRLGLRPLPTGTTAQVQG